MNECVDKASTENAKRTRREAALRKAFARKRARVSAVYEGRRVVKSDVTERLDLSGPFPRVVRTPRTVVTTGRDGKAGALPTLVVVPDTGSRDRRKAFAHWCQRNGVSLVPCERAAAVSTVRPGETLARNTDVTAFQAFGLPADLERLKRHEYLAAPRGKWYYLTDAKGGYGVGTLARKPVTKLPYKPKGALAAPEYTNDEREALFSELADKTCRRLFGHELFTFLAYCDDECAYAYADRGATEALYLLWTAARLYWEHSGPHATEPTNQLLAELVGAIQG